MSTPRTGESFVAAAEIQVATKQQRIKSTVKFALEILIAIPPNRRLSAIYFVGLLSSSFTLEKIAVSSVVATCEHTPNPT